MLRWASHWRGEIFIAIALFAATLTLILSLGLNLTWDSNFYLIFSQAMRLNFDFSTQDIYAPGYSAMIAALTALGATTAFALALVHSASIAVVAVSVALLVRSADAPRPFAALAGLYAAFASAGSIIFQAAWTEAPFTAWLAACTAVAVLIWRRKLKASLWYFLTLGVLPLIRFIGMFPVGVLSMAAALRLSDVSRLRLLSLARIGAAIALAFGPVAAFALSTLLRDDCVFGCRPPSAVGLEQNLASVSETFIEALPELAAGALMLLAAFVVRAVSSIKQPVTCAGTEWAAWAIPLAVIVATTAGQLYTSSTVEIDPIGQRYFAPLYPLALAAAMAGTWRLVQAVTGDFIRRAAFLAVVLACAISFVQDAALYTDLAAQAARSSGIANFGFKLGPTLPIFQDAQARALAGAGSIALYYPRTSDTTDLAAYLVLDSDYNPPGHGCRIVSINLPQDAPGRVGLSCRSDNRRKVLSYAVLNDLRDLPADAVLVVMDKRNEVDDAAALSTLLGERFEIVSDSPTLRILRRRI